MSQAGHPFYAPYVILAGETTVTMAPRLMFSSGGTLAANARAQVDSWQEAIELLKR